MGFGVVIGGIQLDRLVKSVDSELWLVGLLVGLAKSFCVVARFGIKLAGEFEDADGFGQVIGVYELADPGL